MMKAYFKAKIRRKKHVLPSCRFVVRPPRGLPSLHSGCSGAGLRRSLHPESRRRLHGLGQSRPVQRFESAVDHEMHRLWLAKPGMPWVHRGAIRRWSVQGLFGLRLRSGECRLRLHERRYAQLSGHADLLHVLSMRARRRALFAAVCSIAAVGARAAEITVVGAGLLSREWAVVHAKRLDATANKIEQTVAMPGTEIGRAHV